MSTLARGAGSGAIGSRLRGALFDAGPLAAAGLAANAANVVVTVVLARLLAAHDYGALTQLTGVFLVVSTPGSAVIVAVVRHVVASDVERVPAWARLAHRRGLLSLAVFALAVLALGPLVSGALGRSGAAGFDAVTIAGAVWVLLCLDRGLLQAKRAYRSLSANLLVEGCLRTACMLAFVGAGWGVTGAASGILAGEAVTALHARIAAGRAWRSGTGPQGAGPRSTERMAATAGARITSITGGGRFAATGRPSAARADTLAALGALAAVAILQNADVIVIARTGPSVAGAYAAVSVSSKFIVFAALVIGWYMLPEAAIRWREGEHALGQLAVALVLLAAPASVLLAVAAGVPRPFIDTFFSQRYVHAAGAFLPLAGAMVCLSATVVLSMYLLAIGNRRTVALLATGAAAATVGFVLAGGRPVTTAEVDLAVQACVTACAAGQLALVHRRRARAGSSGAIAVPAGPDMPLEGYARRR